MASTMNDYFNDSGYQEPPREREPRRAEDPYSYQFSDYEGAGGAGKPPKKGKRGLIVFASILAAVVVLSLVSFTGYGVYVMMTGDNFLHEEEEAPSSAPEAEAPRDMPQMDIAAAPSGLGEGKDADGGLTTEAIAAKVSPSAVRITAYQAGSQYGVAGGGTGIVLSEDGYIVTNAHVVENAAGLTITLLDEGESYNAVVVGQDTVTDLAVVRLEADPMPALTPAEFGDSDALKLGERVVAIGNAGGNRFSGSVTSGIISGLNRQIVNQKGTSLTVLQTDAAINPGNSGGPLINKYGQVIGINSAKYAAEYYEGIGFAIPSNSAKPIVDDLIRYGRVTGRARLGVRFYATAITSTSGAYLGLPPNVTGLLVLSVDSSCDVAKKGVVAGDVFMAMDGTPIESFYQLHNYILGRKPGDEVTFDIYRPAAQQGQSGRNFSVTVRLEEDTGEEESSQEESQQPQQDQQPEDNGRQYFGSFPFFPFY